MLDVIYKAFDKLPPLSTERNPNVACLVGFLFGGIGIGIYFRSFVDFVLLLGTVIALTVTLGEIGYLGGMVVAALYGYFRVLSSNATISGDPRRELGAWRKPKRSNVVLLLGDGRVGKTQLLKTLTNVKDLASRKRTRDFDVVEWISGEVGEDRVRFAFTDYRGQDAGLLTQAFTQNFDERVYIGGINSLVLMVDLFVPPARRRGESDADHSRREDRERDKQYEEFSPARVADQVAGWNRNTLDLIFGLLPIPGLKGVCLFVNKVDKWKGWGDPAARRAVKSAYKELIQDLELRAKNSGVHYDTIMGLRMAWDWHRRRRGVASGPESLER